MMDVVDSDELLRRIQRARTCAQEEVRAWRARDADLTDADADAARDARTRGIAYEAVLRVLDEIVTPGRSAEGR
ncbi:MULTISPECIES: hypothetical protein [unclassified Streptomyces]|uniref:hypothetical protein n=1 Tax=unclassified Streptomyces TaxID=2593676 RepID=UPI00070ACFBB|nr:MULTISPECIES: hypothetical protein [unclassified Streptomyces]KRD09433.1 hypothetical protein ASE41_31055 [Streptomyces sp. Root264]MCX5263897.1 hypothetical protein [Streptomyces sp. NBC_00199]